jgi:type IV secretory pathway VirB2 component (pilin)
MKFEVRSCWLLIMITGVFGHLMALHGVYVMGLAATFSDGM